MFGPDLIAALVGLVTFAAIIGGATLWSRIKRECAEAQRREDIAATRLQGGAGRFIGGVNRPGVN